MKVGQTRGIVVTIGLVALMHVFAGCTPTAQPTSPPGRIEASATTAGQVALNVQDAQLIVPGERIGRFELGARIDEILQVYPDAKLTNLGPVNTCYAVTEGVALCACRTTLDPENRAARVFLVSIEQPNDRVLTVFRTREGIGLDSSVAEVQETYGDATEFGRSFGARFLLYETFPQQRFDGNVQFVLATGEESGLRMITIGIPRGDTSFCELE